MGARRTVQSRRSDMGCDSAYRGRVNLSCNRSFGKRAEHKLKLVVNLTVGSSDSRVNIISVSHGGIDDWDKVPSFDAGEGPRRSI